MLFALLVPKYLNRDMKAAIDLLKETFKVISSGYNGFGIIYVVESTPEIINSFCETTGVIIWN